MIPPSIPFVIYGGITGVSVGRLFLGGVVPGVLMGLFMMSAVYLVAKKRGYRAEGWPTLSKAIRSIWRAIPVMLFPFIILGGIFSGVVTPTEAAVVTVAYAVFLAVFFYHELTPPVGMTLYVMVGLANISVTEFTKECGIFMLALVVVLGLITYIPGLVTFLPQLIMGN